MRLCMLETAQKGVRNGQGGSRRLRAQEESERARADSKLCQAHALTSAGEDRCGVHPAEAISVQGQEASLNCTVRPSDKNLSAWV